MSNEAWSYRGISMILGELYQEIVFTEHFLAAWIHKWIFFMDSLLLCVHLQHMCFHSLKKHPSKFILFWLSLCHTALWVVNRVALAVQRGKLVGLANPALGTLWPFLPTRAWTRHTQAAFREIELQLVRALNPIIPFPVLPRIAPHLISLFLGVF